MVENRMMSPSVPKKSRKCARKHFLDDSMWLGTLGNHFRKIFKNRSIYPRKLTFLDPLPELTGAKMKSSHTQKYAD